MNTFMSPFVPREYLIVVLLLAIWSFLWKGYALWIAAKHNHKGWFVVLLIVNTLGILEMIYIFGVVKKKWADVKNVFAKIIS